MNPYVSLSNSSIINHTAATPPVALESEISNEAKEFLSYRIWWIVLLYAPLLAIVFCLFSNAVYFAEVEFMQYVNSSWSQAAFSFVIFASFGSFVFVIFEICWIPRTKTTAVQIHSQSITSSKETNHNLLTDPHKIKRNIEQYSNAKLSHVNMLRFNNDGTASSSYVGAFQHHHPHQQQQYHQKNIPSSSFNGPLLASTHKYNQFPSSMYYVKS